MTVSPSLRGAESPAPERRLLRRRLSLAHVFIAIVGILAFVLNLLVLSNRDETVLVSIATEPLIAGSSLNPDALRLVPIDASFEGVGELVTDGDLASFEGYVLQRSIPAGGLIDRSAMVAPNSGTGKRTMSIPVPVEHAAGGSLISGDRVDVITVADGVAIFAATDLEVVAVADLTAGSIGVGSAYHVVVAVTADEALKIAAALEAGPLDLVRSTGAEKATTGGDGGDS